MYPVGFEGEEMCRVDQCDVLWHIIGLSQFYCKNAKDKVLGEINEFSSLFHI